MIARERSNRAPHSRVEADPNWEDPDCCPFCGSELADGGAGFIDHTDESLTCKERFEVWREGVVDDIGGEWSG